MWFSCDSVWSSELWYGPVWSGVVLFWSCVVWCGPFSPVRSFVVWDGLFWSFLVLWGPVSFHVVWTLGGRGGEREEERKEREKGEEELRG